jgi:UDP:flavonoid glycosyltransferase YjiC (YdhE family)
MPGMSRERRFLFVTWDGGGNLPPALGIAAALVTRGHSVRFLGHRRQRDQVEALGFRFAHFEHAPDYDATVAITEAELIPFLFDHIVFEPLMADDVAANLAEEPADCVVVDCMLTAPLAFATAKHIPTAVLVHTLHRFFDGWDIPSMPGGARLATLRKALGLDAVRTLHAAWLDADRVLVTSAASLDPAPAAPPPRTVHVGPVGAPAPVSAWDPAWVPDGDGPLVLVSLSTTSMGQENLLNRICEALAPLPVRAVVTTGAGVDLSRVHLGANAVRHDYLDHSAVLGRAALVVCHGGHGTVGAAMLNGVPMVCIPLGRDQPMVAAAVAAAGIGVALPGDVGVQAIRDAVTGLLADGRVAMRARDVAGAIRAADPASVAVAELEAISQSRSKTAL